MRSEKGAVRTENVGELAQYICIFNCIMCI